MNTIHAGHAPAGKLYCGAVGILNESTVVRDVLREFMLIQEKEYNYCFVDITSDDLPYSLDGLCKRADMHAQKNDYNISLHVNASGTSSANGCEVLCYSRANLEFCTYLGERLSEKLGVKNRGVKFRPELKFLNSTKGRSVIIEPFFCTNANDCNTYNNGGNEKIARAILETMEHFGLARRKSTPVEETSNAGYTVQVGAFSTKENAEKYKNKLNTVYGIYGFVKEK